MKRQFFGTDGIRGRVGGALAQVLTPELVLRLGYAAGKVLTRMARESAAGSDVHPAVLIGKDTRISGYLLESALEAGFSAAGVDVLLCGPIPTPAIAYLTRAFRVSAGVVISASHNPYYDNGIKFFSHLGDKLSDEIELMIENELVDTIENGIVCVESELLGKAKRVQDAAGRYIEFCKSTFPGGMDLRGMRLVVDCAHGAAYQVAPNVFRELGAEVIVVANQPDGVNINANVGATHPSFLQAAMQKYHADIGLALDGDADRLLVVDCDQRVYNGDELIYVLAKDRINQGVSPRQLGGVVGTLMTNAGVEHAIRQLGIEFIRANVGDRYVLEKMNEKSWLIGGESSGHILCLDKHSTGDGIIAALQILAAMRRQQKSLAELLDGVNLLPQLLHNIRLAPGENWQENQKIVSLVDRIQQMVNEEGRVLVRKSGTEPVLRIMVESNQLAAIEPLFAML